MATTKSKSELIEEGKSLREKVNRKDQGIFKLNPGRKSVLDMIIASNEDRLQELVPIRHHRMSISPFTFYRGTAGIMAYDLHQLPYTGLKIQSVGDCHIMNFGGFATPERTLIFDINDFDETFPAPWEWDLKRLAASFILAAYNNHISKSAAEDIVFTISQEYQRNMQAFSEMSMLDLWYMKFDITSFRNETKNQTIKNMIDNDIAKANKQTHKQVFYKITQQVLGQFSIAEQPPLVFHPYNIKDVMRMVTTVWGNYLNTLQPERRFLISQYRIVDGAMKVVGVGSVGTRCYVILLMNGKNEPLFIQVKEARPSILEPYTGKSLYSHQGQRVVEGQRLIQAASDIFLGWSTGPEGRHFYFRQLKDKKIAPDVERYDSELLTAYAKACGRMIARAHAKTGNADVISSYIGQNDNFNDAIVRFAVDYAQQTIVDYEEFMKAVKSGKIPIKSDLESRK